VIATGVSPITGAAFTLFVQSGAVTSSPFSAGTLDRGDSVSQYVKRDKDKGFVEIELKDEPRNHVIRRELEKAHNK
jgi:hypothetical protein